MTRVFVYGTLRPGGRNQHFLDTATRLGGHATAPRYTLYDTGAYPAAIDGGTSTLVGDVFCIDADTLAALDVLEGYPVFYTRRLIETTFGKAWIYLWIAAPDPAWPAIADGDWMRYQKRKTPMAYNPRRRS